MGRTGGGEGITEITSQTRRFTEVPRPKKKSAVEIYIMGRKGT